MHVPVEGALVIGQKLCLSLLHENSEKATGRSGVMLIVTVKVGAARRRRVKLEVDNNKMKTE